MLKSPKKTSKRLGNSGKNSPASENWSLLRNGKPSALMISVSPETLEESLREIRRALFSVAVSRMRRRAETEGIPDDEAIVAEIDQSRKERDLRRRSEPKD